MYVPLLKAIETKLAVYASYNSSLGCINASIQHPIVLVYQLLDYNCLNNIFGFFNLQDVALCVFLLTEEHCRIYGLRAVLIPTFFIKKVMS